MYNPSSTPLLRDEALSLDAKEKTTDAVSIEVFKSEIHLMLIPHCFNLNEKSADAVSITVSKPANT